MKQLHFGIPLLVLSILVAVFLLAACASTPSTPPTTPATSPATTTPAATTPVSTNPGYTFNISNNSGLGDYLVDANGMTLYYFTKDVNGVSNAAGAVLQNWPVVYAQNIVIPSTLDSGDFATITRADGNKQTTYYGWPLYLYAGDKAPGDIKGDGVGGVWFLIKVDWYTVLIMTRSGIGNYLADADGKTLYWTSKDTAGQSNVTGTVLANWPVFYSRADSKPALVIPSALKSADFGTITRADGTPQTTYKGWPLYYFIQDKASGDTSGQGVGGVWFAVDPAASGPMSMPATSTPASTTPAPTPTPTPAPAPSSSPAGAAVTINLAAKNMAFDMSTITVPAGAKVTINFNNQDGGIPHNFSLFTDSSANPPALFQGQIINGPATVAYTFTAPAAAGTYFFRCDIHPTLMTGSFVVTAQ
jgi:predicted lipoprotein with Yx(FWY)xxD motif/plastocyanin